MIPRTCSKNPNSLRHSVRSSPPLRPRCIASTVFAILSCGTHATPKAGATPPPSQMALIPACHFACFAGSKSAPSGPTIWYHRRIARTALSAPTTTKQGSSVYINASKSRACEPYSSEPSTILSLSHRCTSAASRAAYGASSSSNLRQNACMSAFASRCATCELAVKPIAIARSVVASNRSDEPPSSSSRPGSIEPHFHNSLFR